MVATAQFTLGDAVLRLTASTAGMNKSLGQAQRQFQQKFGNIAKMGANLERTMRRVGLGIGIGLGFAIKGAADFDKSMRRVNTIARLNAADFNKLSKVIREQAKLFGRDASAAANTYYNILSAGVTDPKKALSTLTEALKASVGGLVDADIAAKAITGVMNQFGKETISAAEANDTLFKLVERGVTTFEEIAISFSEVGQLAGPLNLDLDEMASIVATLTLSTNSAARATTQVAAGLTAWLKPNKDMIEGIGNTIEALEKQGIQFGKDGEAVKESQAVYEELGVELAVLTDKTLPGLITAQKSAGKEGKKYREIIKTTRVAITGKKKALKDAKEEMETMTSRMGPTILKTVGLQKAMETLSNTVDDNIGAFSQMLGRKEAVAGALGIIGDRAKDVADNMEAMADKVGVAQQATDEMAKSASEKFNKLKTEAKDLGIEIGNALIPQLLELARGLTPVVEKSAEWVGVNKDLLPQLVKLTALVLVTGPLVRGLVGFGKALGIVVALLVGGTIAGGAAAGAGTMISALIALTVGGGPGWIFGRMLDRWAKSSKELEGWLGKVMRMLLIAPRAIGAFSRALGRLVGNLRFGGGEGAGPGSLTPEELAAGARAQPLQGGGVVRGGDAVGW